MRSTDPLDLITFLAVLLETGIWVAATTMTAVVSVEARELHSEKLRLLQDLNTAWHDSARWRAAAQAHVTGLSRAIESQFRTWGLTEAEADSARLMLKGLSHKEIAMLRQGSEATRASARDGGIP